MRNCVLVLVIGLLLAGCATTSVVLPQYKDVEPIQGKSCSVYLKNYTVNNLKDVTDDLGEGNPQTVFKDFFDVSSIEQLAFNSTFANVSGISEIPSEQITERALEITPDYSIYMDLPLDGTSIQPDSTSSDYTIFIEDLTVSRTSESNPGFAVPMGNGIAITGGGSSVFLEFTFEYAMWDNTEKQLVCYGYKTAKSSFLFAMTLTTWENAVKFMIQDILDKTPFQVTY